MRLVGSSLSDINFQCFKQWFLKLIHFHWFFKVLAICRKVSYHSYDFKYIFFFYPLHRSSSMFLIRTPWISSFSPLLTHTLYWILHRKRINHGFLKLRFIFPLRLESFVIWAVQNYQFALVPPSPRGKHLAANTISELILYASLIRCLGMHRDYSQCGFFASILK